MVTATLNNACVLLCAPSGCNENDTDHLDRDQQAYAPTQKTKRMRTSFKHHQLRTMKSYFAINHNPDAKDLKQLAQKTGLTKRVLQVRRTFSFSLMWSAPVCVHTSPSPSSPSSIPLPLSHILVVIFFFFFCLVGPFTVVFRCVSRGFSWNYFNFLKSLKKKLISL